MIEYDILISELDGLFDVAWEYAGNDSFDTTTPINVDGICSLFKGNCYGYYRITDLIDMWFQRWLYTKLQKTAVASTANKNNVIVFERVGDKFFFTIRFFLAQHIGDLDSKDYDVEKVRTAVKMFTNRLQNVFELVKASTAFLNYRPAVEKSAAELKQNTDAVLKSVKKDLEKIKTANQTSFDEYVTKLKGTTEEELNSIIKHSSESSITILGIFVGVVMVFFGGFTVLENAIDGLTGTSFYRLYFTMLLFGGMLYNTVILLFFLIGRVTDRSIACKCHKTNADKCSECEHRVASHKLCALQNKFPYIYWVDMLILLGMIFIVVLYYSDKYIQSAKFLPMVCAAFGVLLVFLSGLIFELFALAGRLLANCIEKGFKKSPKSTKSSENTGSKNDYNVDDFSDNIGIVTDEISHK